MCYKRVVERVEECVGDFMGSLFVQECHGWIPMGLSRCLGSNLDHAIKLLSDELVGLNTIWDLPWCICSEFNIIQFPSEFG